jgi:hypothetical protein
LDDYEVTKIIAYCALLYGKDYLKYSIQSVIDAIDEYHVLYALNPSHGHASNAVNPDTKDELRAIAESAAGSKLRWHENSWQYENEQRESIHHYVPDADVILIVDSDEIYTSETLAMIESEMTWQGKYIRIPAFHFWRSFHKGLMHDAAAPTRVIFPKSQHADWVMNAHQHQSFLHFGYAQRSEIVKYKMQIHGHFNEFRTDCDWFKDKFMANAQEDVHPCGHQWAHVEDVNPDDVMPDFMKSHPYYGLKLIP